MSTESATDFEWSVKLIGSVGINVGIASQLKPKQLDIMEYDENAILYGTPHNMTHSIKAGSNLLHSGLPKYKTGDVIRFRFQPHLKKISIDLVRN